MQAGSPPAPSILASALRRAAAGEQAEKTIADALDAVRAAVESVGACITLLDEPHQHFHSGTKDGWTSDADLLVRWAQGHPTDMQRNHTPPSNFRPTAKTWYTVRATDAAFTCVWYDGAAVVNEGDLAVYLDMLGLVASHIVLQRQQERTRLLANSTVSGIADPVIVLDENRHVLMMNPAAEALFTTTNDNAHGKPLADVVRSDELIALIDRPGTSEDDTRPPEWVTGVGERRTYSPLLSVVKTPNGTPNGWVLALRDMTRFKRLNRNQQEFLRVVSHDLRSPLTSMQGFADMIRMGMVGDVTDKQVYFLDKILSGITQMTGIVDNIQDAGRYDPETGFYDMQRSHVDVGEIALRIVQSIILPPEKQNTTLKHDIADNVPIINADEHMLTRAITNLVDNAIKYTPDGGNVTVVVRREDNELVIDVTDDGLGITEDNQRRLFQRHVRLVRKEHKKIKGTGLGLFIVRSVAQHHGGDAKVQSVPGEGTTFSIVIPLSGANLIGGAE